MKTDELIDQLARSAAPVVPRSHPWQGTAAWLTGAASYFVVLAALMTSSADLADNGISWRFLLPQIVAIVTSGAAAAAAFASMVPGTSPRVRYWPVAAAGLWVGVLVVGSVREWPAAAPATLAPAREWLCVAMIGLGGALPALALTRMLRPGAPLTPGVTGALVGLAATGLANVAACVTHPHTSSAVLLLWHGATVAVLVTASAWAGRRVFSWDRLRRESRQARVSPGAARK
jgi:hypothetical protein